MNVIPLSEADRVRAALEAAAYLRWHESRAGKTPTSEMTQRYILGFMNDGHFVYDTNDLTAIELLALSMDTRVVEAFIAENSITEKLDRASALLLKLSASETVAAKNKSPWKSALALLYPIAATAYISTTPSSRFAIAGYGIANLSYLLIFSGIVSGTFLIFGLKTRIQVFGLAALLFVIAFWFSNI
jgi:hypothetical protein